jgi:alginate O-acetyltransferase complex protein AlgI
MQFNSVRYFAFLIAVVCLYWRLPFRGRRPLLLVSSYLFYMNWLPEYGLLILFQTGFNYAAGMTIARALRGRAAIFWLSVTANLVILGLFKYANFVLENLRAVASLAGQADSFSVHYRIILPLGISFFTFEFIHYLADVYRGDKPITSWVDFALFPAFFPTQIAGPIKRYQDFIPQLAQHKTFDGGRSLDAIHLIVRGLFKKVALADNLAAAAGAGFGSIASLGALDAWVAVLAFTFQIYFDFSGYTDIGRGSAMLLGFDVPENFDLPYLAKNIVKFWQRWHITLSFWLRDYLYFPLGLTRLTHGRQYTNLLITMTLGGLWHGASWTFVIWGFYHGFSQVVYREWQRIRAGRPRILPKKVGKAVAIATTFLFVVVGWVFFRAATFSDAFAVLARMCVVSAPRMVGALDPDHWVTTFAIVGAYAGYLSALNWLPFLAGRPGTSERAWVWRAATSAAMLLGVMAFPGGQATFIYFQF